MGPPPPERENMALYELCTLGYGIAAPCSCRRVYNAQPMLTPKRAAQHVCARYCVDFVREQ